MHWLNIFFPHLAWEICAGSGECWDLVGSLAQWSIVLTACCYQASSHHNRRPKFQPRGLLQHFPSTSKRYHKPKYFILMHSCVSLPGGYSWHSIAVDKGCGNSSKQCHLWQEDHACHRWAFLDNPQHPHWGDHEGPYQDRKDKVRDSNHHTPPPKGHLSWYGQSWECKCIVSQGYA